MYTKLLTKLKTEFAECYPKDLFCKYPEATDFDLCVILLRACKLTYGQISSKMGSPSKKASNADEINSVAV